MTQTDTARHFADLHVPGTPLVLYNIWDAAGAQTLAKAGAKAVATGSWSVAAAHGYPDGEAIPLDLVLRIVERITASVDIPVTVDFEGAYAEAPEAVGENVRRLIGAGAIGLNFEDRRVGGEGLHAVAAQSARIAAIRAAAEAEGVALFINARTDLFLQQKDAVQHGGLVEDAGARGRAYAEAGASGFFVPGLDTPDLIRAVVEAAPLPVNVMMTGGNRSVAEVAALGVARASYGPVPFMTALKDLGARWAALA